MAIDMLQEVRRIHDLLLGQERGQTGVVSIQPADAARIRMILGEHLLRSAEFARQREKLMKIKAWARDVVNIAASHQIGDLTD